MELMLAGTALYVIGNIIAWLWGNRMRSRLFWAAGILMILCFILMLAGLIGDVLSRVPHGETTYYLEAEVFVSSDSETIFTSDQGYYTTDGVYPDDRPYLLTMRDNCTKDTADDEAVVVWTVADQEISALG